MRRNLGILLLTIKILQYNNSNKTKFPIVLLLKICLLIKITVLMCPLILIGNIVSFNQFLNQWSLNQKMQGRVLRVLRKAPILWSPETQINRKGKMVKKRLRMILTTNLEIC